jgi:hypothetical protein
MAEGRSNRHRGPRVYICSLNWFYRGCPYTYRFEGELYTGLYEVPAEGTGSAYMKRFAKGKRFVVRVNPAKPEVSIMRDRDQVEISNNS